MLRALLAKLQGRSELSSQRFASRIEATSEDVRIDGERPLRPLRLALSSAIFARHAGSKRRYWMASARCAASIFGLAARSAIVRATRKTR